MCIQFLRRYHKHIIYFTLGKVFYVRHNRINGAKYFHESKYSILTGLKFVEVCNQ